MDDKTMYPVIDLMENQKKISGLGGTMRLGSYDCKLNKESVAYQEYGVEDIKERHRHRYEFNNLYREDFIGNGMRIAGVNPQDDLVEIIELQNHPWFVGVQFHPEYKSTVASPHPLFVGFVKAALKHKHKNK
jgi:CTP synthase